MDFGLMEEIDSLFENPNSNNSQGGSTVDQGGGGGGALANTGPKPNNVSNSMAKTKLGEKLRNNNGVGGAEKRKHDEMSGNNMGALMNSGVSDPKSQRLDSKDDNFAPGMNAGTGILAKALMSDKKNSENNMNNNYNGRKPMGPRMGMMGGGPMDDKSSKAPLQRLNDLSKYEDDGMIGAQMRPRMMGGPGMNNRGGPYPNMMGVDESQNQMSGGVVSEVGGNFNRNGQMGNGNFGNGNMNEFNQQQHWNNHQPGMMGMKGNPQQQQRFNNYAPQQQQQMVQPPMENNNMFPNDQQQWGNEPPQYNIAMENRGMNGGPMGQPPPYQRNIRMVNRPGMQMAQGPGYMPQNEFGGPGMRHSAMGGGMNRFRGDIHDNRPPPAGAVPHPSGMMVAGGMMSPNAGNMVMGFDGGMNNPMFEQQRNMNMMRGQQDFGQPMMRPRMMARNVPMPHLSPANTIRQQMSPMSNSMVGSPNYGSPMGGNAGGYPNPNSQKDLYMQQHPNNMPMEDRMLGGNGNMDQTSIQSGDSMGGNMGYFQNSPSHGGSPMMGQTSQNQQHLNNTGYDTQNMGWKTTSGDIRKGLFAKLMGALSGHNNPHLQEMAEAAEQENFNSAETLQDYQMSMVKWLAGINDKLEADKQQQISSPNFSSDIGSPLDSSAQGQYKNQPASNGGMLSPVHSHASPRTQQHGPKSVSSGMNPSSVPSLDDPINSVNDTSSSAAVNDEASFLASPGNLRSPAHMGASVNSPANAQMAGHGGGANNSSFNSTSSSSSPRPSSTATTMSSTSNSTPSSSSISSSSAATTSSNPNPLGKAGSGPSSDPSTKGSSSPFPTPLSESGNESLTSKSGQLQRSSSLTSSTNPSTAAVAAAGGNQRRTSGKGTSNNNPHSVDSGIGIGSPRSVPSNSNSSPKIQHNQGTSPSLAPIVSANSPSEK